MARSKSPAPKRASRAAPAAKIALTELSDNTQLGVACVVLAAAWYQSSGGKLSLGSFGASTAAGFDVTVPAEITGNVPGWSDLLGTGFNLVLILHVFNTIQNNMGGGGYWLNNFAQTVIAGFAGVILPAIMSGGNMVNAIFANPGTNFSLTSFFFAWYLMNHDIPFCPVEFDLWGKVTGFGGHALDVLLGFGSNVFTTNLIVAAVGTSAGACFTTSWFQAIAMGIITGTASSFFPFNKGVKFAVSDEATHAMASSIFIASDGFAIIDFFTGVVLWFVKTYTMNVVDLTGNATITTIGAEINKAILPHFGGAAAFVVTMSALNYLFGDLLSESFEQINLKPGFDGFGILSFVLGKCQLE